MSKSMGKTMAACLAVAGCWTMPGVAGTIISVSGAPNTGISLSSGQAAGVGFTLGAALTNVTITAPLVCAGACSGAIYLHKNTLGAGTSFADSVAVAAFGPATPTPYFSLPSLAAGDYFFLLQMTGSTGSGGWVGSNPPTVIQSGGTHNLNVSATTTEPFAPFSNFSSNSSLGLNYTVTGDAAASNTPPVPEPSTGLMGLAVLGLLGSRAARGRRGRR